MRKLKVIIRHLRLATQIKYVTVQLSALANKLEITLCRPRQPRLTILKRIKRTNQNNLDEGITSVGSKGSDKVASNHEPKNVCDGITNLESKGNSTCGPVDGTGSKGLNIVRRKAVNQYKIMNLRSRSKRKTASTRNKQPTIQTT